MFQIHIPNAGDFDTDVDIFVLYGFDLDFVIQFLGDYDFEITYVPHFVHDGGKSNADR